MNKREQERRTHQLRALKALGFTECEADKLRRISMTLRRWHELECGIDGGCIERDDGTDKPYWRSERTGRRTPVADREKGARRRLLAILRDVNGRRAERASFVDNLRDDLSAYVQTDPRGAALYIMRPTDLVNGANIESCYTRGICVY